jgi:hypothetical protein
MRGLALVVALFSAVTVYLAAPQAQSNCTCRCVNGSMQSICSNALDIPAICPPTVCPIVPPSITPIQPPTIPPIGTSYCRPQQVLNPYTNRYEWRSVCQ